MGSPTVWGTDGSGTPQVTGGFGGADPPVPVIVSGGGAVPLAPAAPVPPVDEPSCANSGVPNPALHGPCMPSGMQPTWSSVTLPVSETNTRDRSGWLSPGIVFVALPAETNATRCASREI